MEGLELHPAAQFWASVIIGVVLIGAAVLKYFHSLRAGEKGEGSDPLQAFSLAFGNSASIERLADAAESIAQSMKEIRAILDKEAERALGRHDETLAAMRGDRPPRRAIRHAGRKLSPNKK